MRDSVNQGDRVDMGHG